MLFIFDRLDNLTFLYFSVIYFIFQLKLFASDWKTKRNEIIIPSYSLFLLQVIIIFLDRLFKFNFK